MLSWSRVTCIQRLSNLFVSDDFGLRISRLLQNDEHCSFMVLFVQLKRLVLFKILNPFKREQCFEVVQIFRHIWFCGKRDD